MRTTLALDDELVAQAQAYTGLKEKSRLVREALKALIERESARRLARLGGSEPDLDRPRRRRRIMMPPPPKPKPTRVKVHEHRQRLRSLGLRPIQIWVPDVRAPSFRTAAHRQSLAVAASAHARKDQTFIEAVSDWGDA
ncbi:MAG: antitoxin MazE-like protein [Terriglobales bacterium]